MFVAHFHGALSKHYSEAQELCTRQSRQDKFASVYSSDEYRQMAAFVVDNKMADASLAIFKCKHGVTTFHTRH
jgi:hypothetical protein